MLPIFLIMLITILSISMAGDFITKKIEKRSIDIPLPLPVSQTIQYQIDSISFLLFILMIIIFGFSGLYWFAKGNINV